MGDSVRRRELAEFIRSRRERLTPRDVGIVSYGQRKTPGLRRQEVADLANLGVAWYTWLEQARDINVSDEVLGAIARALRLSPDERGHLLALGQGLRLPREILPEPRHISPAHHAVLAALEPNPALIRDEHWNMLAWNHTFGTIVNIDTLAPADRNLLRIIFTDESSINLHVHWEETAAFAVAQFRFECAHRLQDPEARQLIDELHDLSPEFGKIWRRQEVDSGLGTTAEWRARPAGELVFDRAIYPVQSATDPAFLNGPRHRMCVYIPRAGTETGELLRDTVGAA
jgi:transcriptional regulator with XRE-family HTH domain